MKTKLQKLWRAPGEMLSLTLLVGVLFAAPSAFAQFPFPGGGGGNGRNSTPSGGLQAATQVTAVADDYSNSLIILAPENYQQAIKDLVAKLDVPVQDVTELRVFPLRNADPTEMATVLTSLFPDETSNNNNNGRGPGFFFGRGGRGGNNNSTSESSDRSKKMSKVLAVPDPRTSSIIVSASKDLMEQIAPMIEKLDDSTAKKQKVYVYSLQNADPTDVQTVLQSLFETQNTRNSRNTQNNNNQQNNALRQRQTNGARNQGTTTGNTGFGNTSGAGGSGLGTGR